jgi:hypothetical protein
LPPEKEGNMNQSQNLSIPGQLAILPTFNGRVLLPGIVTRWAVDRPESVQLLDQLGIYFLFSTLSYGNILFSIRGFHTYFLIWLALQNTHTQLSLIRKINYTQEGLNS